MKNNPHWLALILLFFISITVSAPSLALPSGQNQILLQTDTSKRDGETAFSYMVTWRKGDSNIHRANGLTFIEGLTAKKPTSATEVAKKLSSAINSSINYDAPQERGAIAKNTKNKAELLVSNKNGFDLSQITTRDYSNQKLHYSIPGKSFKTANVNVSIDIVYSAAVEYVEGFSAGVKHEAAGGFVKVTIDNNATVEIKTDGKTTKDIENELAKIIGSAAQFSTIPLYPNFTERKSRNYKPFDGGEIQLRALNAKSISIDVNDSGLGVLTKFDFPDVNKPTDVAGNIFNIIGVIIALAVAAYFLYSRKISQGTQV
jgi:hypothetical protein